MSKIGKVYLLPALSLAFVMGLTSCRGNQNQSATQVPSESDPAAANLAPVSAPEQGAAPAAAPVQSAGNPAPNPPPPPQNYSPSSSYSPPADSASYDQSGYDQSGGYDDTADEQPVYAPEPPPALPDYEQPECPGDNYIWTPGYWNYAPAGYYWAPGAWILAPYIGALWTPGYWGFASNRYAWHHGYWGPHIGFYGGINYGHGYFGNGYEGGYWNRGAFYYNRSITRVNVTSIRNVYVHNVTIVNNNRVSYNGGRGGLSYRPTQSQLVAVRERRFGAIPAQREIARQAQQNRSQFASVNRGVRRRRPGLSL